MDIVRIVKSISKAVVILTFWIVLLVSLVLAVEITPQILVFMLLKSLAVCAVLWILLVIILDALVKTLVADAEEKKAERLQGGLTFHFTKPTQSELLAESEQESLDNKGEVKK